MQYTSNCLGIALKIVNNTCSNVYSIKIIFLSLFTRFQRTLKTRSKPLTWFGHTIDFVGQGGTWPQEGGGRSIPGPGGSPWDQ
jgi:hypothetical protein